MTKCHATHLCSEMPLVASANPSKHPKQTNLQKSVQGLGSHALEMKVHLHARMAEETKWGLVHSPPVWVYPHHHHHQWLLPETWLGYLQEFDALALCQHHVVLGTIDCSIASHLNAERRLPVQSPDQLGLHRLALLANG